MVFKPPPYFANIFIFIFLTSFVSIGILAAPVPLVSSDSSSGKKTPSVAGNWGPNPILYPKRTSNDSLDLGSNSTALTPQEGAPYSNYSAFGESVKSVRDLGGRRIDSESRGDRAYVRDEQTGWNVVPPNGELALHDDVYQDNLWQHGYLGGKIGDGSAGQVFAVRGGWPYGNNNADPVVAKWYKKKSDGILEIENLKRLNLLIFSGVDDRRDPALWAIMKKAEGVRLEFLKSYLEVLHDKKLCEAYMGSIRETIKIAHKQIIHLPHAPLHGDIHQFNALFKEYLIDGKYYLECQLIDWGRIDLDPYMPNPTERNIESRTKLLHSRLETGWWRDGRFWPTGGTSFNNEDNCSENSYYY